MLVNFIVLFTLFYLLVAVIDIIVNLDEFDTIAGDLVSDGSIITRIFVLLKVAIEFEGPRLFQVFSYLHGVIAIGAMAFTAASMHKAHEFVAIMAVGISLRRISIPFVLVTAGISLLALINQEFISGKFNYNIANGTQFRYYRMHLLSGQHTERVRLSEMDFVNQ